MVKLITLREALSQVPVENFRVPAPTAPKPPRPFEVVRIAAPATADEWNQGWFDVHQATSRQAIPDTIVVEFVGSAFDDEHCDKFLKALKNEGWKASHLRKMQRHLPTNLFMWQARVTAPPILPWRGSP